MSSTRTIEADRVRALDRDRLPDSPRESDFDATAEAAADLCDARIGVVNRPEASLAAMQERIATAASGAPAGSPGPGGDGVPRAGG